MPVVRILSGCIFSLNKRDYEQIGDKWDECGGAIVPTWAVAILLSFSIFESKKSTKTTRYFLSLSFELVFIPREVISRDAFVYVNAPALENDSQVETNWAKTHTCAYTLWMLFCLALVVSADHSCQDYIWVPHSGAKWWLVLKFPRS